MSTIRQREVARAYEIPHAQAFSYQTAAAVERGHIIQISGGNASGEAKKAILADASLPAQTKGHLAVALSGPGVASNTETWSAVPWMVLENQDTSSLSAGDAVFLSDTAGGWSATRGTTARQVGEVLTVSATVGKVLIWPARYQTGSFSVSHFQAGAGSLADQAFFIANKPCRVLAIREVHSAAESSAGTLSVQVTKDSGTDAPGAGDDLLTNNSNAGFDLKATANTVQVGTLTGTEATLELGVGDRLSVDATAAGTEIAGMLITVELALI